MRPVLFLVAFVVGCNALVGNEDIAYTPASSSTSTRDGGGQDSVGDDGGSGESPAFDAGELDGEDASTGPYDAGFEPSSDGGI